MAKKVFLFFSPFLAIPEHSFIEKRISELLKEKEEFEVLTLGCNGVWGNFCLAMTPHKISFSSPQEKKNKICNLCQMYRSELYNHENAFVMESFFKENNKDELRSLIDALSLDDLLEFHFENLPIGHISSYEFILNHKISNLSLLTGNQIKEFREHVFQCCYVIRVISAFLEKYRFDSLVVYNRNYSVNNALAEFLAKKGISTFSIHYAFNLAKEKETLQISTQKPLEEVRAKIKYFLSQNKNYKNKEREEEIKNHFLSLLNGISPWVYSTKASGNYSKIIKKMGLNEENPIALLAMSSSDELFAAEYAVMGDTYVNTSDLIFKDQIDWVYKTLEFFKKNQNLQLIIRIHPREFPNRRDSILSNTALFYSEYFKNLPPNIFVNFPKDNFSLYDLLPFSKVVLTSWSSVGLEAAMFKVPSISVTNGISLYPNSYASLFPKDQIEYFKLLNNFMLRKNEILIEEKREMAINWSCFDFFFTSIRFSTYQYWNYKRIIPKKIVQKLTGNPIKRNYSEFKKYFSITETEKNNLLKIFTEEKNTWEIKNPLDFSR